MVWDIFIAAGVSLTQLVITAYGVIVSVQEKRLRIAVVIGVIGGLGIGLTIWGAIRTGVSQQRLEADITELKKGQQTTNTGIQYIENTPPSVTVNPQINVLPSMAPPQHTHLSMLDPEPVEGGMPYWPLSPQKPFEVNIGYWNAGEFAADDAILVDGLVLVDTKKLQPSQVANVYHGIMDTQQLLGELHKLRGHGRTVLPHTGLFSYVTVAWGAPKQADIDQFFARQTAICTPARIEWKDKSGCYFFDSFYCLLAQPGSPGYNWVHEVDQETKCH